MSAWRVLRAAGCIAAAAIALSGCVHRNQVATQPNASASAAATEAATSSAPAPEAQPSSSSAATAQESPGASTAPEGAAASPTPTPTGPINLLSFSQGTILRAWPPTDSSSGQLHLLTDGYSWQSKTGSSGPFVFVFELAWPAQINSLGFVAYETNADPTKAAQSVRVESSTQSAQAGFTRIGDYTLKATADEQDFPLSSPATARWLRVTIQQRASDFTTIQSVFAYGKLQPVQPKSVAGVWLYDDNLMSFDDTLLTGSGLPATPDAKLVNKEYDLVQVVDENGVLRAGKCKPNGLWYVGSTFGGTQSGASVSWQSTVGDGPADGVVNAEDSLIVGPRYVMMRLAPGPDCTHVEPPTGSGQNVLVLHPEGRGSFYYPASHADQFPGFRFTALAYALLTRDALAKADTVVLYCIDRADTRIAPWQAQALTDFVNAGHKMIIYDADKCFSPTSYSFLPYPFKTANPGAQGASSDKLFLVESDTLGSSDKSDTQHFYDPKAYASDPNNQIGDANTVTTSDPHWCGHLFGTNVLNVNGFMQMYALYGKGLIIYDGFDQDNSAMDPLTRLTMLELRQPIPPFLPCTSPVAGKFVVEPSRSVSFTAGRAATLQVPLEVLANQGWAGTVSLASKAPADAPWKADLSQQQVTLKGDTAPFNLTISVPAGALPGSHEFVVSGDDGQSHTSSATITLVAQPPPTVEHVKPTKQGCKEQLTLGSDALFAFGEATLTPTAQKTLALLGPTLKNAGRHPIHIYGYTDSIGSDSYNLGLSEQRARTVRDWLAAHGYIKASTPIEGFGKQHPIAPNTKPDGSDNPAGRAKNRRVEIVIDTCH